MKKVLVFIILLSLALSLNCTVPVYAENDTDIYANLMKYYSYDVIREYGELFGISNISMQNTASRSSYYVDSDGFRYQIEYISTPNGSEAEVWNYIDDVSESY